MKPLSESAEQRFLFAWAHANRWIMPELELLFAIPLGGSRHILEAKHLKEQGTKRGIPDVCLPVPTQYYHGLWIELKRESLRPKRNGKGGVSPEQEWWHAKLREKGYMVRVCYGANEAIEVLVSYLKQERLDG